MIAQLTSMLYTLTYKGSGRILCSRVFAVLGSSLCKIPSTCSKQRFFQREQAARVPSTTYATYTPHAHLTVSPPTPHRKPSPHHLLNLSPIDAAIKRTRTGTFTGSGTPGRVAFILLHKYITKIQSKSLVHVNSKKVYAHGLPPTPIPWSLPPPKDPATRDAPVTRLASSKFFY